MLKNLLIASQMALSDLTDSLQKLAIDLQFLLPEF